MNFLSPANRSGPSSRRAGSSKSQRIRNWATNLVDYQALEARQLLVGGSLATIEFALNSPTALEDGTYTTAPMIVVQGDLSSYANPADRTINFTTPMGPGITAGDVTVSSFTFDQTNYAAPTPIDVSGSIVVQNDSLVEADEQFDISIDPLGYDRLVFELGTNDTVTAGITDNDTATWSFTQDNAVINEGDMAVFTFGLSGKLQDNETATIDIEWTFDESTLGDFDFTTTLSTAIADAVADYNFGITFGDGLAWNGTTLTYTAGDDGSGGSTLMDVDIKVETFNDTDLSQLDHLANLVEPNESFNVTISSPGGTASLVNTSGLLSLDTQITDDDTAVVSISSFQNADEETLADGILEVTLSNPSQTDTIVNFTDGGVTMGTAASGFDYNALAGNTLNFSTGETTKFLTIDTINDILVEGPETVTLRLTSFGAHDSQITIDSLNDTDSISIVDNETATWSLTGDATVAEGATASYTLALTGRFQTGVDAKVDLAISFPAAATSLDDADTADFDKTLLEDVDAAIATYNGGGNSGTFVRTGTTLTYTHGASNSLVDSLTIGLGISEDNAATNNLVEGSEDYTLTITNPGSVIGAEVELHATDVSVTTTITDGDTATWSLDGAGTVAEGVSASYTLALDSTMQAGEVAKVNLAISFPTDATSMDAASAVDFANELLADINTSIGLFAGTSGAYAAAIDGEFITITYTHDVTDGTVDLLTINLATSGENVAANDLIEGPEDFTLTISDATTPSTTGATVAVDGVSNVVTTVITDGDSATWSIAGSNGVAEGADATYTVSLDGVFAAGEVATVNIGLTGVDTTSGDYANFLTAVGAAATAYAGDGGVIFDGTNKLTFTATNDGDTMDGLVVNLGATDDSLVEGVEDFTVAISAAASTTGATVVMDGMGNSVTTTITDNDTATWSLTDNNTVADTVGEGATASYLLNLSGLMQAGETALIDLALSFPDAATSMDAAEGADFDNTFLTDLASAIDAYNMGGNSGAFVLVDSTLTYTHGGSDGAVDSLEINLDTGSDSMVEGPEDFEIAISDVSSVTEHTSVDTPIGISDLTTITSVINVPSSGFVKDVNVTLNITHTFDGDLDVFLIAPDSTRIELFQNVGGGGDNFIGTILDDEASTSISSGTAPFTGSFRPTGALSGFDGLESMGDWTLEVTDEFGGDSGTLNSWSLAIDSSSPSTTGADIQVSTESFATTTAITDNESATWSLTDDNIVSNQIEEADDAFYLLNLNGFLQAGETASTDLAISFSATGDSLDPGDADDFVNNVLVDVATAIADYNLEGNNGTFALVSSTLTYTHGPADGSVDTMSFSLTTEDDELVEGPEDFTLTLTDSTESSTTGANILISESEYITNTTINDNDVATWSLVDDNETSNEVDEGAKASYLLQLAGLFEAGETATVNLAISYLAAGISLDEAETVDFTNTLLADVAIAITEYNGDSNSGTYSLAGSTLTYTHGATNGAVDDFQIELGISNDGIATNNLVEGNEDFALTISTAASTSGAEIEVSETEYTTTTTINDLDSATWSLTDNNTVADSVDENATASFLLNLDGRLQAGETASVDLAISFPATGISLDAAEGADFVDPFLTAVASAADAYNLDGNSGTFVLAGSTLTYTQSATDSAVDSLEILLDTGSDSMVEGPEDFTQTLTESTVTSTTGANIKISEGEFSTTTTIIDVDSATWTLVDNNFVADQVDEGSTAQYLLTLGGFVQAGETASVDLAISFPNDGDSLDAAEEADFINEFLEDVDAAIFAYNGGDEGSGTSAGTFARSGNTLTFTQGIDDGSPASLQINMDISEGVEGIGNLVEGPEDFTLTLTAATEPSSTGADVLVSESEFTTTTTIDDNDVATWVLEDYNTVSNQVDEAATASYLLSLEGELQVGETATVDLAISFPTDGSSLDAAEEADFSNGLLADVAIAIAAYNLGENNGTYSLSGSTLTYTHGETDGPVDDLQLDLGISDDDAATNDLVEGGEDFALTISAATSTTGAEIEVDAIDYTTTTTIIDTDVASWSITDNNTLANTVAEGALASYKLNLAGTLQAGETATVDLDISFPETASSLDAAEAADFTNAMLTDVDSAIAAYNSGANNGTFARLNNTLTYTQGVSDGTVNDLVIELGVNDDNAATDNLVEGGEDFALTISASSSTTGAEVEVNESADTITTTITDNDSATWSIIDINKVEDEIDEGATASYLLRLDGVFQAGETASTQLAISFPVSGTDGSESDFVDTMLDDVDLAITGYNSGGNNGTFTRSGNTLTYTHGLIDGTANDMQIDLVSDDDTLVESFEEFSLTLSAAVSTSGANIVIDESDDAVTTTINDNDNTDWSLTQVESTINEGDSAIYSLTLSGLIQEDDTATVDLSWTLLTVTSLPDFSETLSEAIASAVNDYNAAASDGDTLAWDGTTLTYTGGDDASGGTMMAPLTIDIDTFDDFETAQLDHLANLVEPDEDFDVTIMNKGGSVTSQFTTTESATLSKTIQDDDFAVVTITNVQAGGENPIGFGTDGLFEFTLSNPSQSSTFVNFTDGGVTAGTAAPGFDYVGILSSGLNFSAGETSKILSVDPVDDQSVEGPETVTIRLTGFTTHDPQITIASSPDNQATTEITDNDNTELTVGDAVINEAEGTATISVTLGKAVQGGFTVPYTLGDVADTATGGTDYDNTGGTLVFAGTVGEVQVITIPIMNADGVESDEFITAKLGTAVPNTVTLPDTLINSSDTGQVTIRNDESANLSVTDFTINEAAGTATVVVTVDNAVQGGFTVDLAINGDSASGSDFTGNGETLTFSGTVGETQSFEVDIINDAIVEIDETINVTLSNVASAVAPATSIDSNDTAVVTIEDNDMAILTVSDIEFVENSGVVIVTVTLDNAVDGGFTVNFATLDGTATSGTDYAATSGTLTFAGTAGETKTFAVSVNEDITIEPNETLSIVLSNIVANKVDAGDLDATDTAIVTIIDDELQSQVGESGSETDVTSDWKTVNLTLSYDNPVVIAGPATYVGVNPAIVRVRNVTATSFEIRMDEWDYLDGIHGPETVDYLVIEAGTHRLSDGSVITAGNQNVTSSWSRVPTGSDGTVLLTTVITDNDSATAIPRINNVGTSFLVKLLEEEGADKIHGSETISWIQFGEGSGTMNGTQFVTGQAPVTHAQTAITFEDSFASPPVFLAGIQTLNGGDPISVRRISIDGTEAVVFLEEETSLDDEIFHTAESVGFLALDAGIIQAVAANDGKLGETGLANLNHEWTYINFSQPYVDPVVVLGTASTIGEQAVTTRVRNVTSTGFEARVQEWAYLDGGHVSESVAYMVMEAGVHVLEDGTTVFAGKLPAVTHAFQRIKFPTIFDSTPVVFTQVNSDNDTAPIVIRQGNVSTTSVDLRLQEEETGFEHGPEVVSWIAIEQTVGVNNSLLFETGTTGDAVTQANFDLSFAQTYNSTPAFFAQLQSINGGDPVSIRYRQLDLDGSQVFLQEERSADDELGHGAENVGYLAFEIGSIFAKNRAPLGRIAPSDIGNIPAEKLLSDQVGFRFVSVMPEASAYALTNTGSSNRQSHESTEAFKLAGSIELTDKQTDTAFAGLAENDTAFDADFFDSLTEVLEDDA